jgi:transposase
MGTGGSLSGCVVVIKGPIIVWTPSVNHPTISEPEGDYPYSQTQSAYWSRNLTIEQEKQLQRLIRDKQPDQLKLPSLWSRIAVQQLIKQLWAMRVPIRTVGEYLKRWEVTPQKPYRRAYEQNPKKVKQWLEER